LTGNAGKLAEASHFFAPLGYQVEQFLIDGKVPEIIEPQADGLRAVATAKIQQARNLLETEGINAAILVEDAGLFIDTLNGFPGVYSASVLQQIGLSGILQLLAQKDNRGAEFRACAAIFVNGEIHFGEGICRGLISLDEQGENGFGYDPIFCPEGGSKGTTFGQMNRAEKEQFSHRAKALESVKIELDALGR